MIGIPFIAILVAVIGDANAPPAPHSAAEVVARMIAHDAERQAALHGYTAARRYVLENGSHRKRAEMLVRMSCREDGSKAFEVVSESGWGALEDLFFRGSSRRKSMRRGPGFASSPASLPTTTRSKWWARSPYDDVRPT